MHVAVGYAIAGLVAARIVWGFIGARHACFSDFVRPPVETLDAWAERVEGIDAGADDYLTKPFAWRSCSRACCALLRRAAGRASRAARSS